MPRKVRQVLAIIAIVFMAVFAVFLPLAIGMSGILNGSSTAIATVSGVGGLCLWLLLCIDTNRRKARETVEGIDNTLKEGAEAFDKELQDGTARTQPLEEGAETESAETAAIPEVSLIPEQAPLDILPSDGTVAAVDLIEQEQESAGQDFDKTAVEAPPLQADKATSVKKTPQKSKSGSEYRKK